MATTTATPKIPATIKQQIGNKAFFMLGASNYMYSSSDPNWLSFRIKGSPKVNYIKVTYTYDSYTMEFGKIHGSKYKVVKTIEGVYFDQLHSLIEENTGLYTSL